MFRLYLIPPSIRGTGLGHVTHPGLDEAVGQGVADVDHHQCLTGGGGEGGYWDSWESAQNYRLTQQNIIF